MLTLRTKALLFMAAACGLGIGILAPLSDGLYSALALFLFPFVLAVMAFAVGLDLSRSPVGKVTKPVRERPGVKIATQAPVVTSQSLS